MLVRRPLSRREPRKLMWPSSRISSYPAADWWREQALAHGHGAAEVVCRSTIDPIMLLLTALRVSHVKSDAWITWALQSSDLGVCLLQIVRPLWLPFRPSCSYWKGPRMLYFFLFLILFHFWIQVSANKKLSCLKSARSHEHELTCSGCFDPH